MKRYSYLRLALDKVFIFLLLCVPVLLSAQPAMCEHSPSLQSKLKFMYPLSAERNGIEGVLLGRVLVAENGHPVKAEIIKRSSPECWVFDNAVISALTKASYKAATKDGIPVRRWLDVPVWFRLKDSSLQPWTASTSPDVRNEKPFVRIPKKQARILPLEDRKSYERTYVKVLDREKFGLVKEKRTHGPVLKMLEKPYYPKGARLSGAEGVVFVKVSVSRNGTPKKAVIVKHDPFNCKVFDKSAHKAAMESEFYPARSNGVAVDGTVTIAVPYFYVQKFSEPVYCEIKTLGNASL
ncbi:energy transducer TonB [Prosthecochloris sp.]|uniref:energy transducer TonB n=1 Tax=Prosthecochloris sp. TaxID=290513 RepID=UPI0025FE7FAA|nr:energy transducer TonB [Prosthecochloris sp.]